jgi:hypothetical protein
MIPASQCWLICATILALGVSDAYGQQGRETLLTGVVIISIQEPGKSDGPYMGPPFGGAAPGMVLGVRIPSSSATQLAVEASLARPIHGKQSGRGLGTFLSSHTDRIFSALAAWTPTTTGSVVPTFLGGASVVLRHTTRMGTPIPGSTFVTPSTVLDDTVVGIVGGVDGAVRISSRLSFMPTLRVHYLLDQDRRGDGVVKRGVGPFITRIGGGIGIRF